MLTFENFQNPGCLLTSSGDMRSLGDVWLQCQQLLGRRLQWHGHPRSVSQHVLRLAIVCSGNPHTGTLSPRVLVPQDHAACPPLCHLHSHHGNQRLSSSCGVRRNRCTPSSCTWCPWLHQVLKSRRQQPGPSPDPIGFLWLISDYYTVSWVLTCLDKISSLRVRTLGLRLDRDQESRSNLQYHNTSLVKSSIDKHFMDIQRKMNDHLKSTCAVCAFCGVVIVVVSCTCGVTTLFWLCCCSVELWLFIPGSWTWSYGWTTCGLLRYSIGTYQPCQSPLKTPPLHLWRWLEKNTAKLWAKKLFNATASNFDKIIWL